MSVETTFEVSPVERILEEARAYEQYLLEELAKVRTILDAERVASTAAQTPAMIRTVMAAEPERVWGIPRLVESLLAAGWEPGGRDRANLVRTTLHRLHQQGVVQRIGRGSYRLADGVSL